VFAVAFSPDGQSALSGPVGTEDSIILWDLESGEFIHRFPPTGENNTSLMFNPDRRTAYADGPGGLMLLDLETGEYIHTFPTGNCCTGLAIHPVGKSAFVVLGGAQISQWDLETDELIRDFGNHDGFRTRLEITQDGRYLLSSDSTGILYLWDLETGKEIRRLQSDVSPWLIDIDVSLDGRYAISPGANGTAILWDLTLPIAQDGVRKWITANRYVREPTCEEREVFSIGPLCGE
jgi:WD40 repeat protein